MKYCQNPVCEWEATHSITRKGDTTLHLCEQCNQAFEMGQCATPYADAPELLALLKQALPWIEHNQKIRAASVNVDATTRRQQWIAAVRKAAR